MLLGADNYDDVQLEDETKKDRCFIDTMKQQEDEIEHMMKQLKEQDK